MRACNIKIEHLDNPIGIDVPRPYISWTCEGGIKQTAYEIKAFELCAEDGIKKEIWESGKVFLVNSTSSFPMNSPYRSGP